MSAAGGEIEFVEIPLGDRMVRIEHRWIASERHARPLLVFLHEGLGSVAMWKGFPHLLCSRGGYRGLVYSRPGYGASTPRRQDEKWGVDFMHRQAHDVLPALLSALEVADPPWLFGHSDGGSIALLYASRFADETAGAVVVAPHVMVEEFGLASIRSTREAYAAGILKVKLARYHDDPDSAFRGWNDVWLHPPFQQWNIENELDAITCPLLAVQGIDDEYGTLEQIHSIARRVPHARLLELADCGHSPHRDQPERLIAATVAFIGEQART